MEYFSFVTVRDQRDCFCPDPGKVDDYVKSNDRCEEEDKESFQQPRRHLTETIPNNRENLVLCIRILDELLKTLVGPQVNVVKADSRNEFFDLEGGIFEYLRKSGRQLCGLRADRRSDHEADGNHKAKQHQERQKSGNDPRHVAGRQPVDYRIQQVDESHRKHDRSEQHIDASQHLENDPDQHCGADNTPRDHSHTGHDRAQITIRRLGSGIVGRSWLVNRIVGGLLRHQPTVVSRRRARASCRSFRMRRIRRMTSG